MRFTYDWDLQMFGEGGDGAGAAPGDAPAAEGQTGVNAPDAGEAAVNNRRQNRRQQLLNVDYGQAPDMLSNNSNSSEKRDLWQKEQTPEDTKADEEKPAAKEETFEDLINGKYKGDFEARIQDIIGKRLKNQKDSRAALDKLVPAIQSIGKKYKQFDVSDPNKMDALAILETVLDDDDFWEMQAVKEGLSTQATKEKYKVDYDRNKLKLEQANDAARRSERAREEQMQRSYAAVRQQGDKLKEVYPEFDLSTEMRDERFMRLITNNVDVRTAYEVCHRDRFLKQAAQKAAQQVSDSVQANAARPTENGVQAPAAPARTRVTDPRNLTPQMRKDLRNRVRRGEKIYW